MNTPSTAEPLRPSAAAAPDRPEPRRLRVLLSAFASSPYSGSEPGVGWNVAYHLAAHHDVTLLCFPGFGRDAVAAYDRFVAEHGPVAGLTVRWLEQPPLSKLLQREGLPFRAVYYRGYAAWQKAALRAAQAMHRAEPFDLVHHVNIIGYREPGYLWQMGLPFVWGPIAGAATIPRPFFSMLSPKDRAFYGLRNRLNRRTMERSRRCRRAAAAAEKIWAVDRLNQRMVERYFDAPADVMIESGAHPTTQGFVRRYDGQRPLNLLWSGLHEGRKCLPLLLHSLARLRDAGRAFTLTILSRGPETQNWRALARRLGLDTQLEWAGQLAYEQALAKTRDADLFVLSSLQEGTPHVVMEALASGLPVLCHDACGMGIAVDKSCGLKIPLTDPETSIAGFAAAIGSLIDTPERIAELSAGALARAEALSWGRKAADMAQAYRDILGARAE
ncbi:MAG: glycosyltransferase [Planctomycetota bacterium]